MTALGLCASPFAQEDCHNGSRSASTHDSFHVNSVCSSRRLATIEESRHARYLMFIVASASLLRVKLDDSINAHDSHAGLNSTLELFDLAKAWLENS